MAEQGQDRVFCLRGRQLSGGCDERKLMRRAYDGGRTQAYICRCAGRLSGKTECTQNHTSVLSQSQRQYRGLPRSAYTRPVTRRIRADYSNAREHHIPHMGRGTEQAVFHARQRAGGGRKRRAVRRGRWRRLG